MGTTQQKDRSCIRTGVDRSPRADGVLFDQAVNHQQVRVLVVRPAHEPGSRPRHLVRQQLVAAVDVGDASETFRTIYVTRSYMVSVKTWRKKTETGLLVFGTAPSQKDATATLYSCSS